MKKILSAVFLALVVCSTYAEITYLDNVFDKDEFISAWRCDTPEEVDALIRGYRVKAHNPTYQEDGDIPGYYVFFFKEPTFDINYGVCCGLILEKHEGTPVVWNYVLVR